MSYVLFTPPTVDVSVVRTGQRGAARGVARICSPMKVGQTLYKLNGTWHLEQTPFNADLADADPVYLGGHWHYVLESVLEEIVAAGIDIDWSPDAAGTWPSASTFPASNTYPGVA